MIPREFNRKMSGFDVDRSNATGIMNLEEVARYFQATPSGVYKNWKLLGGRRFGGSLFFRSKQDLKAG